MKPISALALLMLAAACSPQPSAAGPEASVTAIYKTLVTSKGEQATPTTAIPMTPELDALLKKVESVSASDGGAPVFDGDLAGNCQDCSDFADLKIERAKTAGAQGHTLVDAHFTLFKKEAHTVQWDMVETPEGWRVDNVVSEGFDARKIANQAITAAKAPVQ
jgi:hypothetical protein